MSQRGEELLCCCDASSELMLLKLSSGKKKICEIVQDVLRVEIPSSRGA